MNAFWFKFFASDFLNDPDVDNLPLEAQAILVRMWCALWIHGSLPGDVEELARKCLVRLGPMQMHLQSLMQFFVKQRDGTYISERQERERQRSGIVSKARHNAANRRWNKGVDAIGSAKPHANDDANDDAKVHTKSMQSDARYKSSEKRDRGEVSVVGDGAEKTPPSKEQEPAFEVLPPDLHPFQYASQILQEIGFPEVRANIQAVAAAIDCEVNGGMSKGDAYQFVLAGVRSGQDEGMEINTFFFSDAKYRPENRRRSNGGRVTAAAQRSAHVNQAIVEGFGKEFRRRAEADGIELEDESRRRSRG